MLVLGLTWGLVRPAVAYDREAAVGTVMARFLQFVIWPETSFPTRQSPLVIGVLGTESQVATLHKALRGRTSGSHRLEIHLLQSVKEARDCQLLYIDAEQRLSMPAVLAATAGRPTITISDMSGFLSEGGKVSLMMEDNHPVFDVNLTAAETSGVKISSRLLQVARSVLRAGM